MSLAKSWKKNKFKHIQLIGDCGLFIALTCFLFLGSVILSAILWGSLSGADLVSMSLASSFISFILIRVNLVRFKFNKGDF